MKYKVEMPRRDVNAYIAAQRRAVLTAQQCRQKRQLLLAELSSAITVPAYETAPPAASDVIGGCLALSGTSARRANSAARLGFDIKSLLC